MTAAAGVASSVAFDDADDGDNNGDDNGDHHYHCDANKPSRVRAETKPGAQPINWRDRDGLSQDCQAVNDPNSSRQLAEPN